MWLRIVSTSSKTLSVRGLSQRLFSTVIDDGVTTSVPTEPTPQKVSRELPESFVSQRKSILDLYPIQGTSGPRQAWVENLSSSKWVPESGLVIQLHPDVWEVKIRFQMAVFCHRMKIILRYLTFFPLK